MRFLSIYKAVERNTPPTLEEMTAMGKLVEEGMKAGWLLSTSQRHWARGFGRPRER